MRAATLASRLVARATRRPRARFSASTACSASSAPPPPPPRGPPAPVPGKAAGGKRRLDELTIERHPEHSRTVVQSWIAQGKVLVNGQPVTKAGTKVRPDVVVDIIAAQPKFVCRGGLPLERALDAFGVDVRGAVALDSGLSTGGFTDCMLQRGAEHVYGVDVGYGQVHERVRVDPRVTVMERTNLRYLQPLPRRVDVAALDLSFISVLKVLPAVAASVRPGGKLIVLIKPQLEARRSQIGSKGVVRDPAVHEEVIANVVEGARETGFEYVRHVVSPIKGAKEGNTEFLALFTRDEREMPAPPKDADEAREREMGRGGGGARGAREREREGGDVSTRRRLTTTRRRRRSERRARTSARERRLECCAGCCFAFGTSSYPLTRPPRSPSPPPPP